MKFSMAGQEKDDLWEPWFKYIIKCNTKWWQAYYLY
jgi:hypothetical protein